MRVVLLILLFVLWETAEGAPASPVSSGPVWFGVGYLVLIGTARLWGGRVARADDDNYDHLSRGVRRFNVALEVARWAVPAWFAVGLFALGWHATVVQGLRRFVGPASVEQFVTPGVVVGLLPPLAAWAMLWWAQYPVDRAARERGGLVQLEAGLPVFAPPSLGDFMLNRLRVQLLFTTVPVLLILAGRDAASYGLRSAAGRLGWRVTEAADSAVAVGITLTVLLVSPLVLRRVLATRRLPDGRLRDQLGEVLTLAGVRCREVLLWDTHHNLGNAAVMGLLPGVRYVLFTDLLVESMNDEHLQAVFAHELGHVRHRHLAWFVGVLGTFMAALSVAADWAAGHVHVRTAVAAVAVAAGLLVAAATIVWVVYGTLSRWFERQADVYAVRLMDRVRPGTGAAAFAGALRRVAAVNNLSVSARNWTHGTIAARVAYVRKLAANPGVADRFDRTGRRVRVGLVLSMLACGTVAVMALR